MFFLLFSLRTIYPLDSDLRHNCIETEWYICILKSFYNISLYVCCTWIICILQVTHFYVTFIVGESCDDKFKNCQLVVQARLCNYSYYKSICCLSCSGYNEHWNKYVKESKITVDCCEKYGYLPRRPCPYCAYHIISLCTCWTPTAVFSLANHRCVCPGMHLI